MASAAGSMAAYGNSEIAAAAPLRAMKKKHQARHNAPHDVVAQRRARHASASFVGETSAGGGAARRRRWRTRQAWQNIKARAASILKKKRAGIKYRCSGDDVPGGGHQRASSFAAAALVTSRYASRTSLTRIALSYAYALAAAKQHRARCVARHPLSARGWQQQPRGGENQRSPGMAAWRAPPSRAAARRHRKS